MNTFELLASSITWLWNDSGQGHKFDSLLFLLSCEWPFDAQMRGKLAMLEQALPLGTTASISFHISTHNAPLCVLRLWGETNKHDGQDQWTTSGRSEEIKITRATTMQDTSCHLCFFSVTLHGQTPEGDLWFDLSITTPWTNHRASETRSHFVLLLSWTPLS